MHYKKELLIYLIVFYLFWHLLLLLLNGKVCLWFFLFVEKTNRQLKDIKNIGLLFFLVYISVQHITVFNLISRHSLILCETTIKCIQKLLRRLQVLKTIFINIKIVKLISQWIFDFFCCYIFKINYDFVLM